MKLHWSPRSPFVRKVMIVAHERRLVDRLDCVRTVAAIGAILAGATAAQREALENYFETIGVAYQIADDVSIWAAGNARCSGSSERPPYSKVWRSLSADARGARTSAT